MDRSEHRSRRGPRHWYDAVYVGSSPTFNASSDTYVTSFSENSQSPLAAGASYTDNESISLSVPPTGDEYLIFVTNYYAVDGDSYYGDAQGETNYANNTYAVPITVSALDLTIKTATGPSSAIEGQSIAVSWTVKNIGGVEAPGSWYDAVYIGSSPTFNASSDTYVTSFSENSQSLAGGRCQLHGQRVDQPVSRAYRQRVPDLRHQLLCRRGRLLLWGCPRRDELHQQHVRGAHHALGAST